MAGATSATGVPEPTASGLERRFTADGSYSLWSAEVGEGFHSARGAVREARETFVLPSELWRFQAGSPLRVVEICVGTGSNTAALLEACGALDLTLQWWGLELDPRPLVLALDDPCFRQQWQPSTLARLEQLRQQRRWQEAGGEGRLLLGDARWTLRQLLGPWRGQVDLIWHDAFSPQRCPQLWTTDVLAVAASLLKEDGRWITYCSAAAVRSALAGMGLALAAITPASAGQSGRRLWSGGTVASPRPLAPSERLRPLSRMEREHLGTSAALPYRDPLGTAEAAAIRAERSMHQARALAQGAVEPSSAWRRRWGVGGAAARPALTPR
jgi:tRNA U34 5-methylaminomethyl-2-thiouridine-forming methyltransferase MnmC